MSSKEIEIDGKPLASLRVVDLKKELEKRGLPKSGAKKELCDRLRAQLEIEKQREAYKASSSGVPNISMQDQLDDSNPFIRDYLASQAELFHSQQEVKKMYEIETAELSKQEDTPDETELQSATVDNSKPPISEEQPLNLEKPSPVETKERKSKSPRKDVEPKTTRRTRQTSEDIDTHPTEESPVKEKSEDASAESIEERATRSRRRSSRRGSEDESRLSSPIKKNTEPEPSAKDEPTVARKSLPENSDIETLKKDKSPAKDATHVIASKSKPSPLKDSPVKSSTNLEVTAEKQDPVISSPVKENKMPSKDKEPVVETEVQKNKKEDKELSSKQSESEHVKVRDEEPKPQESDSVTSPKREKVKGKAQHDKVLEIDKVEKAVSEDKTKSVSEKSDISMSPSKEGDEDKSLRNDDELIINAPYESLGLSQSKMDDSLDYEDEISEDKHSSQTLSSGPGISEGKKESREVKKRISIVRDRETGAFQSKVDQGLHDETKNKTVTEPSASVTGKKVVEVSSPPSGVRDSSEGSITSPKVLGLKRNVPNQRLASVQSEMEDDDVLDYGEEDKVISEPAKYTWERRILHVKNKTELSDEGRKKRVFEDKKPVFVTSAVLDELYPDITFTPDSELKLEEKEKPSVTSTSEGESRRVEIKRTISINSNPEASDNSTTTIKRKVSLIPMMMASAEEDFDKELTPPKNPQTQLVMITNLVRPFTLSQLKELLQRTGTVTDLWVDKIKSKCIAKFEKEEEAFETRVALHGIKWPVSNPRSLHVDYTTQDQLDHCVAKDSGEERKVEIVNGNKSDPRLTREWDRGKRSRSRSRERKRSRSRGRDGRRTRRSSSPSGKRRRTRSPSFDKGGRTGHTKEEPTGKALDELFRKTTTTPCIYWLPLNPQQIEQKEEVRRKRMMERDRRLAELDRLRPR